MTIGSDLIQRHIQTLVDDNMQWQTLIADGAALVAEITGRPLAFLVITEEQLRTGLTHASLPAQVVNAVISIQASFAEGAFDVVSGDVERLGGRPPRPLRDILVRALKSPSA